MQVDERLTATEENAELYQKRFESASKTVAELKNVVQSMFQKLGCSTPAVRELLGDTGVNDRNILQHLSVIEQRVNEILRVYGGSLTRTGADAEHLKVHLGQAALPIDRSRVVIAPPSTMDEDADDGPGDTHDGEEENEPKPLGQEQLLARVQNTLRKKAAQSIFRVPEHSKRAKPPGAPRATQMRAS
jgi:coiled-coil domain-containing protein 63/114